MTDQELIRRVAVEIMGWHVENYHTEKPRAHDAWYEGEIFKFWVTFEDDNEEYFDPLTNANHWIMVVERMREKGFKRFDLIVLENCTMAQFSKEWPVPYGFVRQEDNLDVGYAICLAALDAKEVKV